RVWGDEIVELRHFDLFSQRATRAAEVALVLPVDTAAAGVAAGFERVSLADLWSPDTVLVVPDGVEVADELRRTWDEAQHHIDLARRRGEDVFKRDELFLAPDKAIATL